MFNLHCLWFSVKVGVELSWQWFMKKQSEGLGVSQTQWGSTCDVTDEKRGCDLRWQESKLGVWTEGEVYPADWAAQTTPEACPHFWTTLQEPEHHLCGWAGEGRARRKVLGGWPLQKSWSRHYISGGFPWAEASMWSARPLSSHLTGNSQQPHWAGFLLTLYHETQDYTHGSSNGPSSWKLKTQMAIRWESDPRSTEQEQGDAKDTLGQQIQIVLGSKLARKTNLSNVNL